MLQRSRDFFHLLPRAYKIVAGVVCLALVAGLAVLLWPEPEEPCGPGLRERGPGRECVGVTAGDAYVFSPELKDLMASVAEENARVRRDWEDPQDGRARVPYVKVALMMPFTSNASSAMTTELIEHALAGAHAGQLRANKDSSLQYQLLMANDGRNLDLWRPVVEQLAPQTADASPLVAVMGYPSSTPATQEAADELSRRKIPQIGPVLTGRNMSAPYLFKTSASNEHLAQALEGYLEERSGGKRGFLVWDARPHDKYAENLRRVFQEHFGAEYGLRKRNGSYLGVIGEDAGIPRRFTPLAQKICLTEADTVFYAGRDRDLPALVTKLAEQPSCDHEKPLRIMKVGIGRDPVLTSGSTTRELREARITLVGAADVDPAWWEGDDGAPRGFTAFEEALQTVQGKADLGPRPLDDGYAVMYHDAFTVIAQAADESYTAASEAAPDAPEKQLMPSKDDVYNTIINMTVLGTDKGSDCVNCVRGASGTFGYDADPETDKWPVCKPVPVIEYPPLAGGGEENRDGRVYRTHQDIFGGECL